MLKKQLWGPESGLAAVLWQVGTVAIRSDESGQACTAYTGGVCALEGSLGLLEGRTVPGTVTANMCTRQDIIVVPVPMLQVD
jgi:hypothetical protein